MNKKPSPPQARLLRDLAAPNAFIRASRNYRGQWDDVTGYHMPDKRKRILISTFASALGAGWISCSQDKYGDIYVLSESGRILFEKLSPDDLVSPKGMTAREIESVLSERYRLPEYVCFFGLRIGTGYGKKAEQYIDAWVMNCYPSECFAKTAFEIKVSRSDFLRELKQPLKRQFALSVSNRFYFIAPAQMLHPDEIPPECGLIEVTPEYTVKITKEAPKRETANPDWRFVASLARRLQQEEKQ